MTALSRIPNAMFLMMELVLLLQSPGRDYQLLYASPFVPVSPEPL
jgi:hypothetical protein